MVIGHTYWDCDKGVYISLDTVIIYGGMECILCKGSDRQFRTVADSINAMSANCFIVHITQIEL